MQGMTMSVDTNDLSDLNTMEEPTMHLRFLNGRLQQMWLIYEMRRGFMINRNDVWRDVVDVTPEVAAWHG